MWSKNQLSTFHRRCIFKTITNTDIQKGIARLIYENIFVYFFALFSHNSLGQIKERTFNNELIPSNLKWQPVTPRSFEPINSKVFKNWANFWEPDREHVFSKLDLTGDGHPEYIITNNDFPSGGRAYLILEKKGAKWESIADYQGGTIFAASNVKKGYSLHVYGKITV